MQFHLVVVHRAYGMTQTNELPLLIVAIHFGSIECWFSAYDFSDGRYVITYNGEIYNFKELKKLLETDGVNFVSYSDTEVLLELIGQRGSMHYPC